jgi:hypothetical protein
MKYILLLITLLSTIHITRAQQWCEKGAKWTYSYTGFSTQGYVECAYEKDTVINSKNCNKITVLNVIGYYSFSPTPLSIDTFYSKSHYTFSRNDTVYFWQDSAFVAVYYWGAALGDTLQIKQKAYCDNSDIKTVVDSIGFLQINNYSLRFYRTQTVISNQTPFYSPEKVFIVERLGATSEFLLPYYHCITDPAYNFLRCYEDDSLGLYMSGSTCKFQFTDIVAPASDIEILVHPNPTKGNVTLTTQGLAADTYMVFDLTGRVVLSGAITGSTQTVDVSTLSKGVYLLKVSDKGNAVRNGKLMKE